MKESNNHPMHTHKTDAHSLAAYFRRAEDGEHWAIEYLASIGYKDALEVQHDTSGIEERSANRA
jgi:hypothetical protein